MYEQEVPKRILFVSYTAGWTGPTNSLLLLLKYLRSSYEVSVLVPGHGSFTEKLEIEQIPFFSLPSLSRRSIVTMSRLMKRERFDLVYGNNTSGSSRNALIAAKLSRIPFICHVREMGWGKSWTSLGFLRLSNGVIAVSNSCASSVNRFVSDEKLFVIYNGGEAPALQPGCVQNEGDRNGIGKPPSDYVEIICVGHIRPRKGQEYAVLAMAQVIKKLPCVRLRLVGSLDRDPAYVSKLQSMIKRLKLEGQVVLTGFREDVPRLLSSADIFLHTSIEDPHPRSVIEAMESGLPVVAFSTDGVAETIVDGESGLLIGEGDVKGLANGISKLAMDPSLRIKLGDNGKSRASDNFSAESTATQVGSVIRNTLNEASSRRRSRLEGLLR